MSWFRTARLGLELVSSSARSRRSPGCARCVHVVERRYTKACFGVTCASGIPVYGGSLAPQVGNCKNLRYDNRSNYMEFGRGLGNSRSIV